MTDHHGNTADYRALKRIVIYTDKETKGRLLKICKAEGKSQSDVGSRLLREALASA